MSSLGYLLNNEDFINQNLNQQPGALSNDLRVIFPVGNHLLDFASYNSYGVTPEILEIEPVVFANLLNDSVAYSQTRQELVKNQFFTDESFSGIFTFGKISMSAKAGISYLTQTANSKLLEFDNDVTHYFTKPYAKAN